MLNVGRFSKFGNAMKELIDDVERRAEPGTITDAVPTATAAVTTMAEPDTDFAPTTQVPV